MPGSSRPATRTAMDGTPLTITRVTTGVLAGSAHSGTAAVCPAPSGWHRPFGGAGDWAGEGRWASGGGAWADVLAGWGVPASVAGAWGRRGPDPLAHVARARPPAAITMTAATTKATVAPR